MRRRKWLPGTITAKSPESFHRAESGFVSTSGQQSIYLIDFVKDCG